MKNRLKRLFGKKIGEHSLLPFALTIIVDPISKNVGWVMANFAPVSYELIYKGLDKCRDDFKLQEAAANARAQMEAEAKKAAANKPQSAKQEAPKP
jgi:hypothetical protein